VNTRYIELHLSVVDYYLCNELNWYNYVLIWVVTPIYFPLSEKRYFKTITFFLLKTNLN